MVTTHELIKDDYGYVYRGVMIAKQKSGFSFTVTSSSYNVKGANWFRPLPDSLKNVIASIDEYLNNGAVVKNRKIETQGA